ncbi:MAG: MoaD/ThiS family protein [Candidatus Helarchaeota archaeon]
MPKIKFAFFSTLYDLTNTDSIELEISGTIENALERIFDIFGDTFKARILDKNTGKIKKYIIVAINRKDIRHLNGVKTELNEADEISILPAVAGG